MMTATTAQTIAHPPAAPFAATVSSARTSEGGLAALGRWLDGTGYADLFSSFHPASFSPGRFIELAPILDDGLRALVRLLYLGEPLTPAELAGLPSLVPDALGDAGLLDTDPAGNVHLHGLMLLPVLNHWLFFERPHVMMTLYYGDDSFALLNRLRVRAGMRALDLCCGPGIQTLQLAAAGAEVTSVDINPVALHLAGRNLAVNGIPAGRVRLTQADLTARWPVEGRFDLIVANPPLLPVPSGTFYPLVGDGGDDGLRITRQILHALPGALAPGGRFQTLGTTFSDGAAPMFTDEVAAWAAANGMSATVVVTHHNPFQPGTPMFDMLTTTAQRCLGQDRETVRGQYDHLRTGFGQMHLCSYYLTVCNDPAPGFQYIDLSEPGQDGLWFR
ncbi:SAM-dependent methyltransferase [Azospirillum fermentarium]|uniref:methyltransferase n=1 Tax=Azospirillum fermentarium TaxID=1233114 RepID=UPI002225C52E|nr:methyltransferase [Azospirillum fermentarium]MCW2246938.1 SAM-dependent methyltransferase [Azospirillum fermentarium]